MKKKKRRDENIESNLKNTKNENIDDNKKGKIINLENKRNQNNKKIKNNEKNEIQKKNLNNKNLKNLKTDEKNEKCDKLKIALYDGTNSTLKRRDLLRSLLKDLKLNIIWLELKSDNSEKIEEYVKKSKLEKDYKHLNNKKKAYEDFTKRILEYKKRYQTFSNFEIEKCKNNKNENYISISNFGKNIFFKDINLDSVVCREFKTFLEEDYKI